MSVDQPRQPSGTPVGGRFTTVGRAEPTLALPATGPEAEADALLDESLRDAARLGPRVAEVRARLRDARARQLTASRLPGRAEDHMFWTERAMNAEEDLADLTILHDRTVPGLAALATRHDTALRELTELGSGRDQVDPVSYEFAAEDRRRALRALECATHPELTPVFGADDLPAAEHAQWAHVGMVGAPVIDPDDARPTAWRVSCIDVTTGAELGRVTVPATSLAVQSRDGLDKRAVVAYLTAAARHGERDAAAILANVPGVDSQAA